MAWAERLGYERCDTTVSLLGGAKDYMVAHGLDERKFVHILMASTQVSQAGENCLRSMTGSYAVRKTAD
jgi:hypothetical protein